MMNNMPNFMQTFSDYFLPACACGNPFSMYWTIDPQGRLFCMNCKVHPTLQAIPNGDIQKHQQLIQNGYFMKVNPISINNDIKELQERYAHLNNAEDTTSLGASSRFWDMQDDAEGSKPAKKRQRKPRSDTNSEQGSDGRVD